MSCVLLISRPIPPEGTKSQNPLYFKTKTNIACCTLYFAYQNETKSKHARPFRLEMPQFMYLNPFWYNLNFILNKSLRPYFLRLLKQKIVPNILLSLCQPSDIATLSLWECTSSITHSMEWQFFSHSIFSLSLSLPVMMWMLDFNLWRATKVFFACLVFSYSVVEWCINNSRLGGKQSEDKKMKDLLWKKKVPYYIHPLIYTKSLIQIRN